ncbi:MAG: HIT family protein [Anaerolineales bacterium]|jgi:histidine triad (HIT) family protein
MEESLTTSGGAQEGCPFCRIVQGSVPAWIVYEDNRCLAFLDRRPLFPGHCLLIPRDHYSTFQDLPEQEIAHFFAKARLLSRAVEEAMEAEGIFLAINDKVSQSVAHLHVHLVPRRKKDGLRGFFWPRHNYQDEQEAAGIQQKLRARVDQLGASR